MFVDLRFSFVSRFCVAFAATRTDLEPPKEKHVRGELLRFVYFLLLMMEFVFCYNFLSGFCVCSLHLAGFLVRVVHGAAGSCSFDFVDQRWRRTDVGFGWRDHVAMHERQLERRSEDAHAHASAVARRQRSVHGRTQVPTESV